MPTTKCPVCGNDALEEKHGEHRFAPPPNIPGGEIVIPDATWQACQQCGEEILPYALNKAIDLEATKRQGLLVPEEIRQVRQRTGLTAVDMAGLLGVGDKTYTRWETGKSIQNKANDTLIRLLDANAEAFASVQAERQPNREATIAQYVQELKHFRGSNALAMAAHGGDLGEAATEGLRRRLQELIAARTNAE
ncbi:MAG: type II TA system antitoxin MqsA family protein [Thermoguttaceae bacterium]|jgi:putative zinc finger/helix-turn-helix YgiT family protein